MKLWLLTQTTVSGYDTYDSAVVFAETEEDARKIKVGSEYTWPGPELVTATLLGEATTGIEKIKAKPWRKTGVICASFNAG